MKDLLQFPSSQLQKFFKMGDHVKVISGAHEGETGLILRVEENYVVFFSDLTQKEVIFLLFFIFSNFTKRSKY
jgi:transcription elongation factor SPT5